MNIQPLDSSFAEKLTAIRKHLQNITENDSVLFKQRKVKKMNDIRTTLLLETSYHLSDVTHEPRFPTNSDGLSWMDHLNAQGIAVQSSFTKSWIFLIQNSIVIRNIKSFVQDTTTNLWDIYKMDEWGIGVSLFIISGNNI